MSILVFGHKNPDTDTICSAIAYAELKNKLGKDVKAVRLGEVNEETKSVKILKDTLKEEIFQGSLECETFKCEKVEIVK